MELFLPRLKPKFFTGGISIDKQAIVSLHPGDKVWAYNPRTGKMELQAILHVWLTHDHDLVDLTITSQTHPPLKASQQREVVHTTQKHPFLTLEKGFLPVSQITLGMHVLRADGSVGTITGWKVVPGAATMYNLEGAQDHTYTVGDGLWVVHNCGSIKSSTHRCYILTSFLPCIILLSSL